MRWHDMPCLKIYILTTQLTINHGKPTVYIAKRPNLTGSKRDFSQLQLSYVHLDVSILFSEYNSCSVQCSVLITCTACTISEIIPSEVQNYSTRLPPKNSGL